MLEILLARAQGLAVEPGPVALKAGTTELGYYGQVSGDELITAAELTDMVGLVKGQAISNDSVWLKFAYRGNILMVAKQPFRNLISTNQLQEVSLVTGSRLVAIKRRHYKIRLLLGGGASPGAGSEWNDLIYRVHQNDPTETFWERFTDRDLVVNGGDGCSCWCQETPSAARVYRGYSGLTDWRTGGYGTTSLTTGWRPVLELV